MLFSFLHVVLDEALDEEPHPHKRKNDGAFFQLVPHNPKVQHQSDSLMDHWGKEDVVMCLAHARQTQSTSVPGKLSVGNLQKTC